MPRMILLGGLLSILASFAGGSAAFADGSQRAKGVVELFTSQGCSSCPKADKALETLIREDNVVALAYHVDYWNYLGWTDTFSSKANTERQYAYARMFGRGSVYTPQAVINGREHVNGGDIAKIRSQLDSLNTQARGLSVDLSASIVNDEIRIGIGAGQGKANIVVAYFGGEQTVDITDGQNQGRQIKYWHAVTDMETIGMWEGKQMNLVLPADMLKQKGDGGCAILLQSMKTADTPGAILGATVIAPNETPSQTAKRQ